MIGSNILYDDIDNISDTPLIFACMTDNMLIKHIEQHSEIKDHKHYIMMSSQEQQEYYANLFTRIKERWWVRKVIRSNWYDRAMQKAYEPGIGAGYFSAMSDIDNLLKNT